MAGFLVSRNCISLFPSRRVDDCLSCASPRAVYDVDSNVYGAVSCVRRHIVLEMGAPQSSALLPSHACAINSGSAGRVGALESFDLRRYLGVVEVATRPRR